MSFKRAAAVYALWLDGRWAGPFAAVATAMVILGIIRT